MATSKVWACLDNGKPLARIGVLTDIHHANKLPQGTRYFRQSLNKVDYALAQLGAQRPDRIVHLGDLVDSHPTDLLEEMAARTVAERFQATNIPFHFLMGNHCLSAMDKKRYAEVTGTAGSYEAFDIGGVRFLCFDACYRSDGKSYANGAYDWRDSYIPESQLDWAGSQLATAKGPVVVLTHQLLDGLPGMSASNAVRVRQVLEKRSNVVAVLQGHFHHNRLFQISGIPYSVQRSIVDGPEIEDSGFSMLSVFADGSVKIEGFAKQLDYSLSPLRGRKFFALKQRGS